MYAPNQAPVLEVGKAAYCTGVAILDTGGQSVSVLATLTLKSLTTCQNCNSQSASYGGCGYSYSAAFIYSDSTGVGGPGGWVLLKQDEEWYANTPWAIQYDDEGEISVILREVTDKCDCWNVSLIHYHPTG